MDIYFSHNSITDIPFYNCSIRSLAETIKSHSIQRPARGIPAFIFGSVMIVSHNIFVILFIYIFKIIYILCLRVMLQPKIMEKSCYKIMFILGVYDLITVLINDVILAYSLTFGLSFCDLPNLFYTVGCLHITSWTGASYFCLYLAFNRVLEILKFREETIQLFFSSKRTLLGCFVGIMYSLYSFYCTTPVVYSNIEGTNVPDPLQLLDKVAFEIRYVLLVLNSFGLVILTCILYAYFCFVFRNNMKELPQFSIHNNRLQFQIFVQATLLCAFNFAISISYTIYLFVPRFDIIPKIMFPTYQFTAGFCRFSSKNKTPEAFKSAASTSVSPAVATPTAFS